MAGAHLTRRLAAIKNLRLWAKSNHVAALSTSSRVMYGGGGIPDDLPIKGRILHLHAFCFLHEESLDLAFMILALCEVFFLCSPFVQQLV